MVNKISNHKFLVFLMILLIWRRVISITIKQSRVPGKVNAGWIVLEICLVLRIRIINKKQDNLQ